MREYTTLLLVEASFTLVYRPTTRSCVESRVCVKLEDVVDASTVATTTAVSAPMLCSLNSGAYDLVVL